MLRLLVTLMLAACLVLPATRSDQGPSAATLVIRRGGTYSGTFRSLDSGRPCVRIATTEPVVLDSCVFEGAGTLVECQLAGARLTIRRCVGRGLPPTKDQTPRGRFLTVSEARSVRVEQCLLEQTSGIYVYKWSGDGSPRQTLKVLGNRVRNIDGRYRDGGGLTVSFVGLNQVRGVAGIEIAWNEVISRPDESMVEDNINLYNSSGTPASPIRVHDNYVQGAYPYPAASTKFSGTGMTTDGDGSSALTTTAYVEAYQNQFVSTCNAAMNIAAGHHIRYHHNRLVTSSRLPDGRPLPTTYAATAVFNAYNKPATVFFAHRVDHNVIGYAKPGYRIPLPDRHDLSHENCQPCTDNEHLPNPITLDSERQEWLLWQQKQARRVQVAPLVADAY
ncbi:hypothetical protein EJV47_15295 [Hymenobacter gummosus]|uniref:Right-handed parallel beta-helix repeat-containing protein n=1 Tax=Hymenobacter gummosus TaxID=1776032 RepID=A0A3S0IMM3_9BACT|nr:hypothetical protein [Hymenobacter gummosus]RTQ48956.1 hypothetical protein EJV47_15295 [Hymenobacter gummosus]